MRLRAACCYFFVVFYSVSLVGDYCTFLLSFLIVFFLLKRICYLSSRTSLMFSCFISCIFFLISLFSFRNVYLYSNSRFIYETSLM